MFRVLLIDDNDRVCDRAKRRITRPAERSGPLLPVQIETVPVVMRETEGGEWTFDPATAARLREVCRRRIDLVLIDYGYADPEVGEEIKRIAASRKLGPEDLKGKVLTAADLANWIRSGADGVLSSADRNLIERRLLMRAGLPVYLYSYLAPEFRFAAGEMSERIRQTRSAFPRGRVGAIDTREELYHGPEFAPVDSEHHAYLLAGLLDYTVHKEILRAKLSTSRYLRVRRSALSAAALTAVGAGVGFGSHWLGSLVAELVQTEQLARAALVSVALGIILFGIGATLPLAFERWTGNILRDVRRRRPGGRG